MSTDVDTLERPALCACGAREMQRRQSDQSCFNIWSHSDHKMIIGAEHPDPSRMRTNLGQIHPWHRIVCVCVLLGLSTVLVLAWTVCSWNPYCFWGRDFGSWFPPSERLTGMLDRALLTQQRWHNESMQWLTSRGPEFCAWQTQVHSQPSGKTSVRGSLPKDIPSMCTAVLTRKRVFSPKGSTNPWGVDLEKAIQLVGGWNVEYVTITLRSLIETAWNPSGGHPRIALDNLVVLDSTPKGLNEHAPTGDMESLRLVLPDTCMRVIDQDAFENTRWWSEVRPKLTQGFEGDVAKFGAETLHYLAAMDACLQTDSDTILILEDDGVMVPSAVSQLSQLMASLPRSTVGQPPPVSDEFEPQGGKQFPWAFLRLYNPRHQDVFLNMKIPMLDPDKWVWDMVAIVLVASGGAIVSTFASEHLLARSLSTRAKSRPSAPRSDETRHEDGASLVGAGEMRQRRKAATSEPHRVAAPLDEDDGARRGERGMPSSGVRKMCIFSLSFVFFVWAIVTVERQTITDLFLRLGWASFDLPNRPEYGTVGILFGREQAVNFLDFVEGPVARHPEWRRRQIDVLLDIWARRRNMPWYAPLVSMLHHVGIISTLPDYPFHTQPWVLCDHAYYDSLM
jgi:hypothetical protein